MINCTSNLPRIKWNPSKKSSCVWLCLWGTLAPHQYIPPSFAVTSLTVMVILPLFSFIINLWFTSGSVLVTSCLHTVESSPLQMDFIHEEASWLYLHWYVKFCPIVDVKGWISEDKKTNICLQLISQLLSFKPVILNMWNTHL